jgi:two-component system, cell cycle response regulator
MPIHFSVALIGFTPFERSTFEAFFRLAARRSPCYLYTDQAQRADVVLVDADRPEAMADRRATPQRSVYVGARGVDGQLAHLPRPINMMGLLKLLDGCAYARSGLTQPAPLIEVLSAPKMAASPVWGNVRPAPATVLDFAPAPPPPMAPRIVQPGLWPATPANEAGAMSELLVSRMDNILVVDDSDIALRFMATVLGRFGYDVQLARSGEEALQRVAEQHFEFVFLDVTMPGIDGYQTCKLIKKRPYPAGRAAPSVVMLTSRAGMVDKMRGTLSGCDAYLTKPLQQGDLMRVIGDRVVTNISHADTAEMSLAAV